MGPAYPAPPPRETGDQPHFEGTVVVGGADLAAEDWGADPYELGTGDDAPYIEDDVLILTLSCSGGGARHDFTLATNGHFLESHPVQLNNVVVWQIVAQGPLCINDRFCNGQLSLFDMLDLFPFPFQEHRCQSNGTSSPFLPIFLFFLFCRGLLAHAWLPSGFLIEAIIYA